MCRFAGWRIQPKRREQRGADRITAADRNAGESLVTLLVIFLLDRDKKYALISFTVLLIVVLSSLYGMASH